jgi:nucleotide-binding universal stress UspA family protein
MSEHSNPPVVVAVGHDPMDAALTFAAGEAVRASCGLHLVHVVHHLAQGPEAALGAPGTLKDAGSSVLDAAAELARGLLPPELPVTTELRWGGVVADIVAADTDARMIVLQRRSLSRIARVLTRSVSSGVAAHATSPVVSVPASWKPTTSSSDLPTVAVGVDVVERCEEILRVALGIARERGDRLRILHTWSFPNAYDVLLSPPEHDEWVARATGAIRDVLAGLDVEAEGVEVVVEASHGLAAEVLLEVGRTAELLVVGRHDPLVPVGSHIGPVARAVLQDATCPVLLANPSPRARRGHKRPHAAHVG